MEYDAPFDPDEHGPEAIPEPDHEPAADDSSDAAPAEFETTAQANDREGMSPVAIGVLLVALLLLAAGAFWWLSRGETAEPQTVADDGASGAGSEAAEPIEPVPAPQTEPRVELPPLGASDAFVRDTATRLSEHPALTRWLANDDLVRRFVATVENVANGRSPRSHLEFMEPEGPYRAHRVDGELVTHPATYARYDLMVDVFTSLDIGTTVQLFHSLEPLFDQAYREIAPPGSEFRDALAEAIDQLLAVEVPEQPPELEEAVVSYRYADPELESLSPAEKHLLRLGPERAARVQTKLQFLQAGLDLPSGSDSI